MRSHPALECHLLKGPLGTDCPCGLACLDGGTPLRALPLQQARSEAEQPLLTRVFCTKDKAQVAFQPIFHCGRACARCWRGACPAGALLPPHTPWQGGNLHPPRETREAEADPRPDRANPALNSSPRCHSRAARDHHHLHFPPPPQPPPGLRAASPPPPP